MCFRSACCSTFKSCAVSIIAKRMPKRSQVSFLVEIHYIFKVIAVFSASISPPPPPPPSTPSSSPPPLPPLLRQSTADTMIQMTLGTTVVIDEGVALLKVAPQNGGHFADTQQDRRATNARHLALRSGLQQYLLTTCFALCSPSDVMVRCSFCRSIHFLLNAYNFFSFLRVA